MFRGVGQTSHSTVTSVTSNRILRNTHTLNSRNTTSVSGSASLLLSFIFSLCWRKRREVKVLHYFILSFRARLTVNSRVIFTSFKKGLYFYSNTECTYFLPTLNCATVLQSKKNIQHTILPIPALNKWPITSKVGKCSTEIVSTIARAKSAEVAQHHRLLFCSWLSHLLSHSSWRVTQLYFGEGWYLPARWPFKSGLCQTLVVENKTKTLVFKIVCLIVLSSLDISEDAVSPSLGGFENTCSYQGSASLSSLQWSVWFENCPTLELSCELSETWLSWLGRDTFQLSSLWKRISCLTLRGRLWAIAPQRAFHSVGMWYTQMEGTSLRSNADWEENCLIST